MTKNGMVYLVGAGPGDPGLMTLKGLDCIHCADVIVYDQLANPVFLKEAKSAAELIDVGKYAGNHPVPQSKINEILVKNAKRGKIVTRLKGGDPLIFGRGAEEAEELIEDKIPFEIVPGISSSIAAPAYAGIPVTHRECASTFAVITGHEDPRKMESTINWSKLATAVDTLVILMGIGNLEDIVKKLVEGGRKLSTPVALVRQGTLTSQQTIVGDLKTIVSLAKKDKLSPPAIIIVGEVVKKRRILNWFETKPLFGKRILITRTRTQISEFAKQLNDLGAEVIEFPTIEIRDITDFSVLDNAIKNIHSYDWAIFTSTNGVEKFFARLHQKHKDARVFGKIKIACIGPATAGKLESYGLYADVVPSDEFRAEAIVAELGKDSISGKRILLARAGQAREILPRELTKMGAKVDVVSVYETIIPQIKTKYLKSVFDKSSLPDMITFTSSSTVENFVKTIPAKLLNIIQKNTKIASIGPITTKTAEKLGFSVHVEPKNYTIPGLTQAIVKYYQNRP